MLKLLSNSVSALSEVTDPEGGIRRIVTGINGTKPGAQDYFLVKPESNPLPSGFSGYLFLKRPNNSCPPNSFLLEPDLSYLAENDIIIIRPDRHLLRTIYRKNSPHNFMLLTERCNNFCLMCSQPPKEADDSYLADEMLQTIPLISPETKAIGITGGEPTLLGEKLEHIIASLKNHLPMTAVHILSNGRSFKDTGFAQAIANIQHPDLMFGIPVYSDISSIHDYVVQADGAFDDTIRGIINLKAAGVRVEIRVVLHKITYERLPDLARFIRRNLTFCDHVALMGLEMTGFTKHNLEKLWIDPKDYQPQLKEAAMVLHQARIPVSIYNHQLCLLDEALIPFNRKSISDWKNEYMPECEPCLRKEECGGFFASAKLRYSSHIKPFTAKN